MTRLILVCLSVLSGAFAQQQATVSGTVAAPEALPATARVGVHLVDPQGVWGVELAGTADALTPFRSGEVVLPGLQNDYSLSSDVNFTRAQLDVYLDENGNGTFDREGDVPYLGLAGTAEPVGFFVPLYVDADTTLSAAGESYPLREGWNIFTVRFPDGEEPEYAVVDTLTSARLDVFPGQP